tara:strand:+ start:559 stop:921 length:363 start_codon:yes stop_codon:yes gene_type:complete
MAVTYTWAVTSVKTKTEGDNENAVVQTYWTKTGTDEDGNEGSFSGATPFTSENTEDFVSFAELTEEVVLGWIQAIVIDSYEDHVNGQIQKQIDEKIAPVAETAMPWATEEETVEETSEGE